MENNKLELGLKIESHKSNDLGITAVVAALLNGKEVFGDEVKLWRADSREAFIESCIDKLPRDNLTPTQIQKFRERISSSLHEEEANLKAKAEGANAQSANASCDGNPEKMTQEEEKQALTLLKDSDLLTRVQEDLTKMGVVDEDRVKVLTYLIATSRKMEKGLAGTIKAGSSAGKNHLVRAVTTLMPENEVKEFTQLSSKALNYMGKDGIRNRLVVCTEIAGREAAEYTVRTLISEPFITCAIPTREREGGPFKTTEFRVDGPIAYLDTTTSFRINPENATRIFELYLNETEEQTKKILIQQAREAGPEAFKIRQEREQIKQLHRNVQTLLRKDLDVIIPYSNLIEFPPDTIRARRDFPKLLNLIKVVAYFHQYQREIKCWPNGREYIEATLTDYELAYHIAKETFVETLDELDKRSRDVLNAAKKKLEALAQSGGKKIEDLDFDRDMVAKWVQKKKHKLHSVFQELETREYFVTNQASGTTTKRVYKLNKDLANEKSSLAGLTTPEELTRKTQQPARKPGQTNVSKTPQLIACPF